MAAGRGTRFVIEVPAAQGYPDVQGATDRARSAAEQTGNRFVRAVYVPEDDTCLLIIEAADRPAAVRFAEAAGLYAAIVDEVATTRPH